MPPCHSPSLAYQHVFPSQDAEAANAIVNDASVLPGLNLGLFDRIDVAPIIANPRNVMLLGDHGGAILIWTAPRVYEVHDFVAPLGRGAWAKRAAREVVEHAFAILRARMVWAQTPIENRACRIFNRIIGFASEGQQTVPLFPGDTDRTVEVFVMEAQCP